jgi:hypothetical protein
LNTEHRGAVKIGVTNVYTMKTKSWTDCHAKECNTQNRSLSEGSCAYISIRYHYASAHGGRTYKDAIINETETGPITCSLERMNELLGPEEQILDASDGNGDCECSPAKDFYERNDLIRDGFSFYEFEGS